MNFRFCLFFIFLFGFHFTVILHAQTRQKLATYCDCLPFPIPKIPVFMKTITGENIQTVPSSLFQNCVSIEIELDSQKKISKFWLGPIPLETKKYLGQTIVLGVPFPYPFRSPLTIHKVMHTFNLTGNENSESATLDFRYLTQLDWSTILTDDFTSPHSLAESINKSPWNQLVLKLKKDKSGKWSLFREDESTVTEIYGLVELNSFNRQYVSAITKMLTAGPWSKNCPLDSFGLDKFKTTYPKKHISLFKNENAFKELGCTEYEESKYSGDELFL